MKNIAFGQYYPAKSLIHSLDPRAKMIMSILYIVCAFLASGPVSFAALLLSTILLVLLSRIPLKTVFGSLKAIIAIIIFAGLINIFLYKGEGEPLWHWYFYNDGQSGLAIYKEGIYSAICTVIRIIAMVVGSGIFLTYTTTPIALTDAIEQLLSPLKLLHIPVHDFAMMMTIALRFIPTIVEETEKIMAAQKARGADFTSGGLIRRAKALIPILIPLFVSAFRRAGDLATAMICRCYHGGDGRTKMTVLKYRARDIVFMLLTVAFGVGLVFMNIYLSFGYSLYNY